MYIFNCLLILFVIFERIKDSCAQQFLKSAEIVYQDFLSRYGQYYPKCTHKRSALCALSARPPIDEVKVVGA